MGDLPQVKSFKVSISTRSGPSSTRFAPYFSLRPATSSSLSLSGLGSQPLPLIYKWVSQDPSANTLMPSVPRDLNRGSQDAFFPTLKISLALLHPRFGSPLLLMIVNRGLSDPFHGSPLPPMPDNRDTLVDYRCYVGEWM